MPVPVTQVGKYHILEQIGEGAMGVVYKATDPVLNRTVAVKIMSEGMAHDESLRARFLREAQAAGSLQHPNVVTIYDFGETDGHLFIAMEYITGADLEHLLKYNAPLSLAAKLDIIVDVLNGLSYAHRRGIVHRDIKPSNIRVDDEGHARIMDFGVAHLGTSNLTGTGVMMGTPNYMAPEQISGDAVTPAVDLFSAGAMLYELLTHEKPFQGDTLHSVLFKIVSDTPPGVCELKPELPIALNEIVAKSLAKEPADRYKSAAEMANAISAVRMPLGPMRISKTVSQRISIDKGLQAQREAQRRATRVRRWSVVGVSATAIAAAIAVVVFALRPKPSASPPSIVPPAVSNPVPVAGTRTDTAIPSPQRSVAAEGTPVTTQPPVADLSQSKSASVQRAARVTAPRSTSVAPAQPGRAAPTKSLVADSTARRTRADSARIAAGAPPSQGATAQGTPVPSPPTPVVAAPPVIPAPPKEVAPEPENPSIGITSAITAYGRAIGTRDIAEVRRVYTGMTPQHQSQLEGFFSRLRSLNATFQIASLDVNGNMATARVTGIYEYVYRDGRAERTPVSFEATFQRDADRWKLQAIR